MKRRAAPGIRALLALAAMGPQGTDLLSRHMDVYALTRPASVRALSFEPIVGAWLSLKEGT